MINNLIVVGNNTINTSNIDFSQYVPKTGEINLEDILKNICEEWKGFTFNSHLVYVRCFLLAGILKKIDKRFPIKIKAFKLKDWLKGFNFINIEKLNKNIIFRNILNCNIVEKDTTVFYEIADMCYLFIKFRIIYTFLMQYWNIQGMSLFEILKMILGV
jgi:hypothetical protein